MRSLLGAVLVATLVAVPRQTPPSDRMLLFFDLSGSMTAPGVALVADLHDQWLAEIRRALTKVGRDLSAADHVCLGTLASRILIAPTCSGGGPADLVSAFRALDQRGSPSPIGSAVWSGVEMLRNSRSPEDHDFIVVVTDGQTSGNRYRTADVADFARQNGVAVHVVITRPAVWATAEGAAMTRAVTLMQALTQPTGGTVTECTRSTSRYDCQKPSGGLATVVSRLLDEAHRRDQQAPVGNGTEWSGTRKKEGG
jgi:hypothetical protein